MPASKHYVQRYSLFLSIINHFIAMLEISRIKPLVRLVCIYFLFEKYLGEIAPDIS